MNSLTQFLVDSILKEETLGTVALFGGGFKPPTKGHLEVVLQGLKENPEVSQVYILVGSGARNGVTQAEAVKIWEMYQKFIPVTSQIIPVQSPFSFFKTYLTDHKDEKVYVFIGARPDNEEDDKDVAERSAYVKKYSENAIPVKVQTKGGVSGTMARKAALSGNNEEFISYFPSKLSDKEKQEIIDMISSVVNERIKLPTLYDIKQFIKAVKQEGKETKKAFALLIKASKGDIELTDLDKQYIKNQLTDILKAFGFTAILAMPAGSLVMILMKALNASQYVTPSSFLNENASYSKDIDIIEKCAQLTNYMREKGYNIDPVPAVEFVNGDTENARDFFGKTAYYDPNEQKIVLYTEGRHPKDIVRSYAHEMIHHIQNLEGRLGNIQTTNTQEDDDLNKIEAEANLKGTMTFRNWTDSLNEKKKKDPFGLNQYARELAKGLEEALTIGDKEVERIEKPTNNPEDAIVIYKDGTSEPYLNTVKEGRKKKKDPKKGTGKKPEGSGRRLYTDEDPKDTVGVSFRTKEDIVDTLNKKSFKAKSHARQSQVINLIHQRVRAAYGRAKDPETKARLKRGLDYIEKRKEASKKKTQRLKAQKESLNEGRYDAFVNRLSSIVFEAFKDIHDRGDKEGEFEFRIDHPDDEHDIPSKDFYFDLLGKVVITDDEYEVDGGANAGFDKEGDEITPLLSVKFKIPKNPDWQRVSFDIKDVVRHELEHLTQDGYNVKPGKQMDDDQTIRDLIDLDLLPKADYFRLPKEIDSMLQGLYFKAKKSKKPYIDVINDYLDTQPINAEERKNILKIWRNRAKALSLPVFESETGEMPTETSKLFKIYLDMDGVIVDFDKRFESMFGMPPREFENNFGKEKFWEKIDAKGVGFWRGMDWMPGGQQLYNRVAKHDHALLSSPSRSKTSKIGKHMWRKDNTPDTKLILAQSFNKKNYADKSNILIDDRADNIQQWKDAGGIGILYQSAEQVMKELDKLGL
jgi:hypothetical protein